MKSNLGALFFAAIVFAGVNFGALSRPPSDDDEVGLASQVFNVLAMCSSLMAAAWAMRALWAQLDDDDSKLGDDAVEFVGAFLAIAVFMTAIAITLRVSIVARIFGWAPMIVVLGIGMFFIALMCLPVLAIVSHARWSRMPSIVLGRTS